MDFFFSIFKVSGWKPGIRDTDAAAYAACEISSIVQWITDDVLIHELKRRAEGRNQAEVPPVGDNGQVKGVVSRESWREELTRCEFSC
jgi:hypothetical protein